MAFLCPHIHKAVVFTLAMPLFDYFVIGIRLWVYLRVFFHAHSRCGSNRYSIRITKPYQKGDYEDFANKLYRESLPRSEQNWQTRATHN